MTKKVSFDTPEGASSSAAVPPIRKTPHPAKASSARTAAPAPEVPPDARTKRTRCRTPEGHCLQDTLLPTALSRRLSAKEIPRHLTRDAYGVPAVAPYEALKAVPRTTHHWGQRKLLLSEIEFLAACVAHLRAAGEDPHEYTVVYAGSADGAHLPFLWTRLFPGVFAGLHLYDDVRRYDRRVRELARSSRGTVRIAPVVHEGRLLTPAFRAKWGIAGDAKVLPPRPGGAPYLPGWFTEEVAASYHGQKALFISDIRTVPTSDGIRRDNALQVASVLAMDPAACMLKHRMPFDAPVSRFLDGRAILQLWAPVDSTETRLWAARPYRERDHDMHDYESRMFTFNKLYRPSCFEVRPMHARAATTVGGCRCYDCRGEMLVLDGYLGVAERHIPRADVPRWRGDLGALSADISASLDQPNRLELSLGFAANLVEHIDMYRERCLPEEALPRFQRGREVGSAVLACAKPKGAPDS